MMSADKTVRSVTLLAAIVLFLEIGVKTLAF